MGLQQVFAKNILRSPDLTTAPRQRETSAQVTAQGIWHHFGSSTVLNDVSLNVQSGEFLTLLGPSGSGKTTLLRIIAGMLSPANGKIYFDSIDVTSVPMRKREVGFVFQNYALFPHLSVADNIGFPLDVRKVRNPDRAARIREVLTLVQMDGYGTRFPAELSGGQQQRVAVARAIAARPRLLLLDEPLGALDRRLREDLQIELRRLQREVGTTTIYVTHDQDEAFALSDRIAIVNGGLIEQLNIPSKIYMEPATAFVARFVGDTNLWVGQVTLRTHAHCTVDVGGIQLAGPNPEGLTVGTKTEYVVRPESLQLSKIEIYSNEEIQCANNGGNVFRGQIELVTFYGNRTRVDVRLNEGSLVQALVPFEESWSEGDHVDVSWPTKYARLFPA